MSRRAERLRRLAPLAALAAVLLLAVVLAGPGARDGPPLDPSSTGPAGTKGLVDVLEELGATVVVTGDVPEDERTALLFVDDLSEDRRERLSEWVGAGGTLVVTDPGSPLSPDPVGTTALGFVDPSLARRCEVPALAGVERVSAPDSAVLEVPDGATGCYPRGEGSWLVLDDVGGGTIVALGGPSPFTNRQLDEADNGPLAAALLLGEPDSSVAVLRPALPGGGDATLIDLVTDNVWFGLAQLAIAFAVVVGWRARRLGRPVEETQPVQIAGSELVVAVGNLLQQTGSRIQAARLLRDDLRRSLAQRMGLASNAPVEQVVEACAARGVDASVLTGPDPTSEEELRDLAERIERARPSALRSSSVETARFAAAEEDR